MTQPVNLNPALKGPSKGKPDFAVIATASWGTVPDWILILAEEANRTTQTAAAARIGYSGGAISSVLRNSYQGDMGAVEQKVRGALMGATIECPVIGEIGRDRCLDEQKKPFAATSALRTRLFHACKTCTHNRQMKDRSHAE